MKTVLKKIAKKMGIMLLIMGLLTASIAPATTVYASGSQVVTKGTYTTVCYPGGRSYIKIENQLACFWGYKSPLDVRMVNKAGKVVWQENCAIRAGQSYRTFYCGKNVYRIDIRVNIAGRKSKSNVLWTPGNRNQL